MNETEKTTVKVTRTITEQVLSGGQLKEITRVITEPAVVTTTTTAAGNHQPPPATLTDILKNLTADKQVKQGSQVTQVSTHETEQYENVSSTTATAAASPPAAENTELKERAGQVVNKVVEAAVEKLETEHKQQNGFHHNHNEDSIQEENVKIEEESTVKTSTTKIVLNGGGVSATTATVPIDEVNEALGAVQQEFFKLGKQEAEMAVKKIENNTDDAVEHNKKSVENSAN